MLVRSPNSYSELAEVSVPEQDEDGYAPGMIVIQAAERLAGSLKRAMVDHQTTTSNGRVVLTLSPASRIAVEYLCTAEPFEPLLHEERGGTVQLKLTAEVASDLADRVERGYAASLQAWGIKTR
jgi:hypothetical protein